MAEAPAADPDPLRPAGGCWPRGSSSRTAWSRSRSTTTGGGCWSARSDADRFYLLLNRIVLDDESAGRGGDPGRRGRARGLPVPDRRREGQGMNRALGAPGSRRAAARVAQEPVQRCARCRIYLLAAAAGARGRAVHPGHARSLGDAGGVQRRSAGVALFFAVLYQFILRFVLYFGCVWIFMNLFRGEVLDRSLHYYFLAPIRREVLVAGKYVSALGRRPSCSSAPAPRSATSLLYGYLGGPGGRRPAARRRRCGHLVGYLGVTAAGLPGLRRGVPAGRAVLPQPDRSRARDLWSGSGSTRSCRPCSRRSA